MSVMEVAAGEEGRKPGMSGTMRCILLFPQSVWSFYSYISLDFFLHPFIIIFFLAILL